MLQFQLAPWPAQDLSILSALYDSNLHYADSWVGRLYDALSQAGIGRDTILAITADHGENLGQGGWFWHGFGPPLESVTHVPWILVYPPRVAQGRKVREITESIDIVPTLLDLARVRVRGAFFAGRSVLRARRGGVAARRDRWAFGEEYLRTPKYKYMANPPALYDLSADPNEERDIAGTHPREFGELKALHEARMRPNRELFEESRTTSPPAAFLVPAGGFAIEPADAVQSVKTFAAPEIPGKAAWVRASFGPSGLARRPGSPSAPGLAMALEMPNGRYDVALLVQSWKAPLPSWQDASIRVRPADGSGERAPRGSESVERWGRSVPPEEAQYWTLGAFEVCDGWFRVRFRDLASNGGRFFVSHFRFILKAGHKKAAPSSEELRQIEEGLKAAGYR